MNELVEIMNNEVVTSSKQVAEVFGKQHKDVMKAIKNLIEDSTAQNCALLKMFTEDSYLASNGKRNPMYIMNRDGFTLLAMGFTGSKALEFKMKYIEAFNQMEQQLKTLSQDSYMIDDPVARAKKWIQEEEQRQLLLEENKVKDEIIKEQTPKVEYHDNVLNSDGLFTTTQIAKDYGVGAVTLNKILHDLKVQYKRNGQWLLYSKYQNKGYTKSVTNTYNGVNIMCTKWTAKGRKFIYELLDVEKGWHPIYNQEVG